MLTRREWGSALAGAALASAQDSSPLYFDMHIDTPSRMVSEGLNLAESHWYTCVDIPKMKRGGLHAGFFAVFAPARSMTPVEAVKQGLKIIDVIVEEVKRHPADLFLATTSQDVLRAKRDGKIGVLLGVEGGHMIDSSLEVLRQFHRLGARYLGLTHSGNTPWCGAAEYPDDGPKGLTDFGKQVVREMNRLGMMIDTAHASDQAFFDAIETSRAPILNTHAACRAVANHARNLTDEMLKALAATGGVVQIVAYSSYIKTPKSDSPERVAALAALRREFGLPEPPAPGPRGAAPGGAAGIGGRGRGAVEALAQLPAGQRAEYDRKLAAVNVTYPADPSATVIDFVSHIDYAVKLIGLDHVGISSDFDGGGGVTGWRDASETFNVTLELVRRGYTEEQIAKLWSGNLLRVMDRAQEVALELQRLP